MLYTLRCTDCRHVFDIDMLLSQYVEFIDSANSMYVCPKCRKTMHPTRVIMYPITAIYKGDGFTLRKKENEPS
jgi:NAD-dependent SIR2 family protein deacetylase